MQKHIQRIDVVIGGLFKIEAVFPHLLYSLTFNDFPSLAAPARRASQPREESPDEQQNSQSLSRRWCSSE